MWNINIGSPKLIFGRTNQVWGLQYKLVMQGMQFFLPVMLSLTILASHPTQPVKFSLLHIRWRLEMNNEHQSTGSCSSTLYISTRSSFHLTHTPTPYWYYYSWSMQFRTTRKYFKNKGTTLRRKVQQRNSKFWILEMFIRKVQSNLSFWDKPN